MQAIIMAAGRGSRLGELTDDVPKAFLKVRGHRLIDYNLALLHENGIDDIKIVTGYRGELYDALAAERQGITCIYNPFYEHCNVLGSYYMAQDKLADDDTIYLHADTLCDPDIFSGIATSKADIAMPVDFKQCDQEAMKVLTRNGEVIEVSKKIPIDIAEGEFIGMAKMSAKVMPAVKVASRKLMSEGRLDSYFEGAVQEIINEGKFSIIAMPTEGRFWGEVDFLEDYEYVKENMPNSLWEIVERYGHE